MKKIFIAIVVLLLVISKISFNKKVFIVSNATGDTTVVNPNGSSELSILMRKMQQYTSDEKSNVLERKNTTTIPQSFFRIHNAEITEGMSKNEYYEDFANLYLSATENYVNSDTENRKQYYNSMVSACIACHSQHCPGPVNAIRMLKIED